jgi:hypothetical protein
MSSGDNAGGGEDALGYTWVCVSVPIYCIFSLCPPIDMNFHTLYTITRARTKIRVSQWFPMLVNAVMGHAVAQTVAFPLRRAGFEPGSGHVGFVVDKTALGKSLHRRTHCACATRLRSVSRAILPHFS